METKRKPFLYSLVRSGWKQEDLSFKRNWDSKPDHPNGWALHLDIDDPTPAKVLIFVQRGTKREHVMDEINKAQTYFREQIEPD